MELDPYRTHLLLFLFSLCQIQDITMPACPLCSLVITDLLNSTGQISCLAQQPWKKYCWFCAGHNESTKIHVAKNVMAKPITIFLTFLFSTITDFIWGVQGAEYSQMSRAGYEVQEHKSSLHQGKRPKGLRTNMSDGPISYKPQGLLTTGSKAHTTYLGPQTRCKAITRHGWQFQSSEKKRSEHLDLTSPRLCPTPTKRRSTKAPGKT